MGKAPAVFAGSVLLLFMFFWYQVFIQTECVSRFLCSPVGSQTDKLFQNVNLSQADSGGNAQNDHVEISNTPLGKVAGSSDTNTAGILDKLKRIMSQTGPVPQNKANINEGSIQMDRRDNRNPKVHNESQQHLNVTAEVSTVATANTTKINSLETEPIPGDRHIIFIETGCVLDDSQGSEYLGLLLQKRQACVIESAAKMNPEYKVYLLYSCPINGRLEDSSEHVRPIFTYPNVKLWRLNITSYFSKTPLEKWDFLAAIASSSWPKEHSSDILRLMTLWKYGGIYLDLDVIILKSLAPLGTNFVGPESSSAIANCVLAFGSGGIGHAVADRCVEQIRTNFRGDVWAHNGPGLITRVLLAMCHASHVPELSTRSCKGFQILLEKEFFPISYNNWKLFFDEAGSEKTMEIIKDSYGVHIWNKLSKHTSVSVGSKQPYSLMAQGACPRVYSLFGRDF